MAKRWYVVHVFSGSEKKVCQNIEEQIISKDMGSLIEEVLVLLKRWLKLDVVQKSNLKKIFPRLYFNKNGNDRRNMAFDKSPTKSYWFPWWER